MLVVPRCPICGLEVPQENIEQHVNMCCDIQEAAQKLNLITNKASLNSCGQQPEQSTSLESSPTPVIDLCSEQYVSPQLSFHCQTPEQCDFIIKWFKEIGKCEVLGINENKRYGTVKFESKEDAIKAVRVASKCFPSGILVNYERECKRKRDEESSPNKALKLEKNQSPNNSPVSSEQQRLILQTIGKVLEEDTPTKTIANPYSFNTTCQCSQDTSGLVPAKPETAPTKVAIKPDVSQKNSPDQPNGQTKLAKQEPIKYEPKPQKAYKIVENTMRATKRCLPVNEVLEMVNTSGALGNGVNYAPGNVPPQKIIRSLIGSKKFYYDKEKEVYALNPEGLDVIMKAFKTYMEMFEQGLQSKQTLTQGFQEVVRNVLLRNQERQSAAADK